MSPQQPSPPSSQGQSAGVRPTSYMTGSPYQPLIASEPVRSPIPQPPAPMPQQPYSGPHSALLPHQQSMPISQPFIPCPPRPQAASHSHAPLPQPHLSPVVPPLTSSLPLGASAPGQSFPLRPPLPQHHQHRASQDLLNPMGVAGAPGSVSPSGVVSRISPALIPSVVSVQKADYDRFEGGNRPYFTSSYGEEQTPMSSTEVQIIDNGNASCRFVRSTVYQYPASEELAEACKLPTALTFQPFARQVSSEPPVPLVSYGTEVHPKTGKPTSRGPLRCNRCRGYLNPRVVFEKGGRGWRCNLCSFLNDVPDWFFCDLDATGRRLDHSTRPELQFGTCDFEASPEYILRQGCLPAHLIIGIDCSRASVQNGAFEAFLRSAKALLQNHDVVALYARVALFLFDRNVTFVQAGSDKREDASLVVLPDISEPFMPSPGNGDLGIFFNPLDHSARESVLKALSHSIPATFLETRVVDCCFGAAAALPLEALKSCGGRVVLMCASMANFGPGALKNREAIAAGSQQQQLERVHPLLNPQGDYYTKIAASASRLAISYGLVLCPATYVDSSTLVELTSSTSGFLLMYPKARVGLPAQSAFTRVPQDLSRQLAMPFVYDAIVRLRCGPGLQDALCYGSSGPSSSSNQLDQNFPCISSDLSFTFKIDYDGRLADSECAHFQLAVLHTTPHGVRRIRVLNLGLPSSKSHAQIFKFIDLEAILSYETKSMTYRMCLQSISSISNGLLARSSQIFAAYRKHCTSGTSSGQLVLPETLKLWPVFVLSLTKSPALQVNTQSLEQRLACFRLWLDAGQDALLPIVYPRMIAVHSYLSSLIKHNSGDSSPSAHLVRLSKEFLERSGIYFIENGMKLWIVIGDTVDPSLLQLLFGVQQSGQINPLMNTLPLLDNPWSAELHNLYSDLQKQRPKFLDLQPVRIGIDTALEAEVLQMLMVEDSTPAGPGYADFLCKLHNQIMYDLSHPSAATMLAEKTSLLNFLQ